MSKGNSIEILRKEPKTDLEGLLANLVNRDLENKKRQHSGQRRPKRSTLTKSEKMFARKIKAALRSPELRDRETKKKGGQEKRREKVENAINEIEKLLDYSNYSTYFEDKFELQRYINKNFQGIFSFAEFWENSWFDYGFAYDAKFKLRQYLEKYNGELGRSYY